MKKQIICLGHNGREYPVEPGRVTFRPSVYGVLLDGDKVLLSPQWDGYDLPGGGVNIDESLEEALVREFREETGLEVRSGRAVYATTSFYYVSPDSSEGEKYWNCPLVYFLVEKLGGELSLDYAEEYEKKFMKTAVWVPLADLDGKIYHNSLGKKCPVLIRLAKDLADKDNYKKYDL